MRFRKACLQEKIKDERKLGRIVFVTGPHTAKKSLREENSLKGKYRKNEESDLFRLRERQTFRRKEKTKKKKLSLSKFLH